VVSSCCQLSSEIDIHVGQRESASGQVYDAFSALANLKVAFLQTILWGLLQAFMSPLDLLAPVFNCLPNRTVFFRQPPTQKASKQARICTNVISLL
jgi:hypothetical protein